MEALFSVLFPILLLAAVWHFIVEVLLRPTLLDAERFALYALRDELRRDCFSDGEWTDDSKAGVAFLESSMNAVLHNVSAFTFSFLWQFAAQPKQERDWDELCAGESAYCSRLLVHARNIALIHSLGWLFYLWPLLVVDWLLGRPLWRWLASRVGDRIRQVLSCEYGYRQAHRGRKQNFGVLPNAYSPAMVATC